MPAPRPLSHRRATFIGRTEGSAVRVRAIADGVPLRAAPTLAVRTPRPRFTFCSPTGAVCDFIGLRDVRVVTAGGATYTQTFYGSVPCAASGYDRGFTGAPTADYVRCEIAERQRVAIDNAMPGMAGLDAAVLLVPRGDPGVSRPLIRPSRGHPRARAAFA